MCLNLDLFKNFALVFSRVGEPEPEPHKNDAAPQHWFIYYILWKRVKTLERGTGIKRHLFVVMMSPNITKPKTKGGILFQHSEYNILTRK
jgi:hypothetical protein